MNPLFRLIEVFVIGYLLLSLSDLAVEAIGRYRAYRAQKEYDEAHRPGGK
jgi:hypothetical protein